MVVLRREQEKVELQVLFKDFGMESTAFEDQIEYFMCYKNDL